MANPNANFTDVIATTLQGYSGRLADNITKHNALLRCISDKGNVTPATGRDIVQELEYAENATVKWYAGYETLDTDPSDTFTAAEFQYKQMAGNVVISGLEQVQNSGKEAVHNLVKSRIKNLDKSLRNALAGALYANGTGNDGKEIGGLQLLVADTGLGIVGGIDASANAFWQNQVVSTAAAPAATNIQTSMNSLWMKCIRGADKPDIVVADANYFRAYMESLQVNQRFTSENKASAGFMNLMFMDAPVFYDDQCPENHLYMLNTDYIFLRPAKGREFVPLSEKASVSQDAIIIPVVWAGNMTVSNRALQGVLFTTPAAG
ncbi:MAG TPA: phage major capsid protein [Rhodospirillaceae bacterium]|nr:MAG: hypothetical protein A2018_06760 [Alphaproteobacteria bacterium GWF2_58_20]HAU29883.1 phage major capsid protein [Rhodospirillaceae bacterium]